MKKKILIAFNKSHARLYYECTNLLGKRFKIDGIFQPYHMIERIKNFKPDLIILNDSIVDFEWEKLLNLIRQIKDNSIIFIGGECEFQSIVQRFPTINIYFVNSLFVKMYELEEKVNEILGDKKTN